MPPSLSSRAVKLASLVLRSDAPFDNTNSDSNYPDGSHSTALPSGPSTSAATPGSASAKEFDQAHTFVHAWMVVVPVVVIGLVVLGIAICCCVACARRRRRRSRRPPVVRNKRNHVYDGIQPQRQVVSELGPMHGLKLPSKGLDGHPDDRQLVGVDLDGKELPPQPRSEDPLPPPEYQASDGSGERPSAAHEGPQGHGAEGYPGGVVGTGFGFGQSQGQHLYSSSHAR